MKCGDGSKEWSATVQDDETTSQTTAKALHETLISPDESDSNMEPANVVDGLFAIARAIDRLAKCFEDSAPFRVKIDDRPIADDPKAYPAATTEGLEDAA
jgi:hypothetical protein